MSGLTLVIIVLLIMFVATVIVLTQDGEPDPPAVDAVASEAQGTPEPSNYDVEKGYPDAPTVPPAAADTAIDEAPRLWQASSTELIAPAPAPEQDPLVLPEPGGQADVEWDVTSEPSVKTIKPENEPGLPKPNTDE